MSRRPSLKPRWRRHVLGTGAITDAVRVLLLLLVDHMDERGYVSVPRTELAALLRKHPNRITERITAARRAGLLDTVSRAHPGRTAVYRAVLPTPEWSPKASDHPYPQIGDHFPGNGHPPSGEPVLKETSAFAYHLRSEPRAVKPAATAAVLFASLPALQAATSTSPETRSKHRGAGAMSTQRDQDLRKDQPA